MATSPRPFNPRYGGRAPYKKEPEHFINERIKHQEIRLVGENIRRCGNVAARAFSALDGVHPRIVSQGASQLNLSMVVASASLHRAVESLHREFFRDPDPASFE